MYVYFHGGQGIQGRLIKPLMQIVNGIHDLAIKYLTLVIVFQNQTSISLIDPIQIMTQPKW